MVVNWPAGIVLQNETNSNYPESYVEVKGGAGLKVVDGIAEAPKFRTTQSSGDIPMGSFTN